MAAMRIAVMALWAIGFQAEHQKDRRARRGPVMLACEVCGKPVKVWRLDGRAVYCRDSNRCKMRAYRRRKAQEAQEAQARPASGPIRSQADQPERAAAAIVAPSGPAQLDPAALWALIHRG